MRLTILLLLLSFSAFGQIGQIHNGNAQVINRLAEELHWLANHDTLVFDAKGHVNAHIEPKTVGDEYTYTLIRRRKVKGPLVVPAQSHVQAQGANTTAAFVGSLDFGDYMGYAVNLSGITKVKVLYARQNTPNIGTAEVREGSLTGRVLGNVTFNNTGNWETTFQTTEATLSASSATIVYFIFKTPGTANIKTFTFE